MITWPTASAATPDCASAALAAWTASSVAERPLSVPPMVPKAVRLAPTMTSDFESLAILNLPGPSPDGDDGGRSSPLADNVRAKRAPDHVPARQRATPSLFSGADERWRSHMLDVRRPQHEPAPDEMPL